MFLKTYLSYFVYSGLPSNISYNWNYGSVLGIILIIQIVTGVILGMHYVANISLAFYMIENIMRNIEYGWLIRYFHTNGASMFFLFVYLHMARSLYAGSYIYPRHKLWNIGVIIYILMMAIAFLGKLNSLKRNYSNKSISNFNFKYIKKYENLHLLTTQLKISQENKFKSGIYLIYNNINGKYYIGSAITNRINSRFRNHCLHGTGGSKIVQKSIKKHGLENFTFFILEYYPGFIHKENLKKNHLELLKIETNYINLLKPEYNILTIGGSSLGFKHNQETIDKLKLINKNRKHSQKTKDLFSLIRKGKNHSEETKKLISLKIKENYTEERKKKIGLIHKNKIVSDNTKLLLSNKMKIRYLESDLREKIKEKNSQSIILYNKDHSIFKIYKSKREFNIE
jgi:group I intron endonuclease